MVTRAKFEIFRFYRPWETNGRSSAEEEPFALRSELGKLIRFDRIGRHDALYDASASSRNFETIDGAIINPVDFEVISAVIATKATAAAKSKHIQCFGDDTSAYSGHINRPNFLKRGKTIGNSETHFKDHNLSHSEKATGK